MICGFDVTVSRESSTSNHLEVAKACKTAFKKWGFQGETGKTGYPHWQIRGQLWKPKTPGQGVLFLADKFWKGHVTPTTKGVHSGNSFNYVMKDDTRTEGPWTDQDEELVDPPPLTRQLRAFLDKKATTGLYPWQAIIHHEVQEMEDRYIKLVWDEFGNLGKSIFAEWLEYEGLAYEIPPMTCMEDIMQCCMGIGAQKAYLVDMPRAMKKDKLAGFYSGLEALKNGVMYDKRYAFKKRRIDRPQIVVFTNSLPEFTLMSLDRWKVYKVCEDKSVVMWDTEHNQPGSIVPAPGLKARDDTQTEAPAKTSKEPLFEQGCGEETIPPRIPWSQAASSSLVFEEDDEMSE